MIFVAWIVLAICVGILAEKWKGRDGYAWGLLTFVISPLLSVILLAFLDNIKEEEAAKERSLIFNIATFREDLAGVKSLKEKGVYSDAEYDQRRIDLIKAINIKRFNESYEKTLIQFSDLVDDQLLSKDELHAIKTVVSQYFERMKGAA